MTTEAVARNEQAATLPAIRCVHHWMIESPKGRDSSGMCLKCGARRWFANAAAAVMSERNDTTRPHVMPRWPKTVEYSDTVLAEEAP